MLHVQDQGEYCNCEAMRRARYIWRRIEIGVAKMKWSWIVALSLAEADIRRKHWMRSEYLWAFLSSLCLRIGLSCSLKTEENCNENESFESFKAFKVDTQLGSWKLKFLKQAGHWDNIIRRRVRYPSARVSHPPSSLEHVWTLFWCQIVSAMF